MGSPAFRKWATFVVRHRRIVIGALVLVSALLALGVPRLRLEVDPDRNLPPSHEAIQALQELNERFGDKNLVLIGLFPTSGDAFSAPFLTSVARVSARIEALPGIIHPLFQSIASPAMNDIRAIDGDIEIDPLMSAAPSSQTEADEVRERVFANPSYIETLASREGDGIAIYATFDLTEELPSYELLYTRVRDEMSSLDDSSFEYALSGPVVLAGALGLESARVTTYLPLALILIGLVHYHAFRTMQAIFLPFVTAILAVVWAIGAMGLLDVPLDPFTTTTPILILAVGAGHAVQILKRYYEEYARLGDNHAAIIESIAQIGPVMVAAGTIAALALSSLVTFDLATVRTFGLFGALGVTSILVIELTLIPAVRAALPPPREKEVGRENRHAILDATLGRLADGVLASWPLPILASTTVVVVICFGLASRIHVDTSFKRSFAPGTTVHDDDERLNATFAGTNTLVFLIEAPEAGGILYPESLRAIDQFERRMEDLPGVGKATSIVDTLHFLYRALEDDPTLPLPERTRLAKQILFLYESGGGSVTTQLTTDDRIAKVVVLLQDDSTLYGTQRIADAKMILEDVLPPGYEARIAGTLASNAALTEVVVAGKLINIAQIALVTFLVASVLLRSALGGLLVVVPLLIAVVVDFGVMGAFSIPLDVVTAPVTALGIGIGADYAAYFLFRLREETARRKDFGAALRATYDTSGKAIFFVASANSAGYATLCLSSFAIHVRLGVLVSVTLLAAGIASLTVLPALARLAYGSRLRSGLLGSVLERPEDRA
ncbi:MAG: MMPL family transporter [Candidatus Binatia bacterium]|nr:MMPL family transporter [Candidatus Binatia bacterium]